MWCPIESDIPGQRVLGINDLATAQLHVQPVVGACPRIECPTRSRHVRQLAWISDLWRAGRLWGTGREDPAYPNISSESEHLKMNVVERSIRGPWALFQSLLTLFIQKISKSRGTCLKVQKCDERCPFETCSTKGLLFAMNQPQATSKCPGCPVDQDEINSCPQLKLWWALMVSLRHKRGWGRPIQNKGVPFPFFALIGNQPLCKEAVILRCDVLFCTQTQTVFCRLLLHYSTSCNVTAVWVGTAVLVVRSVRGRTAEEALRSLWHWWGGPDKKGPKPIAWNI